MLFTNELTEYLAYFPQKKDECYKVITTLTGINKAFTLMAMKLPKKKNGMVIIKCFGITMYL